MAPERQQDRLTLKEEAFAIEYVKCRVAANAYRNAYDAAEAKENTIYHEASRLLKKRRVVQRIAEIRAEVTKRAEMRIADIIRELWNNAMQAKAAVPVVDRNGRPTGLFVANWAASNQALIAIGNHLGAFDRNRSDKNSPLDDLTHEELKQLVSSLKECRDQSLLRS